MGNQGTAEVLTRVTALGTRLGIDTTMLTRPALRPAGPPSGARIGTDSLGQRIWARWPADEVEPAVVRPGSRYLELETSPHTEDLTERIEIHGHRALVFDLALLADHQVTAAVREQLAALITRVGGGCDRIARRREGETDAWLIGVEIGASRDEVIRTAPAVLAIAEQLAVPPLQRRYLEQAYVRLAPIGGAAIDLVCTAEAMLPRLVVEVRAVTWNQAVGLANAVRPGGDAGPSFGALAGAFDADLAGALELTFRADAPAWVRVGVEAGGVDP